MLHECRTEAELDAAIEETRKIPAFLNVHYSILFQKTHRFPEVDCRVFWYENEKHEKLFIVSRIYKTAPSVWSLLRGLKHGGFFRLRSFIIFCYDLATKFETSVLSDLFDELSTCLSGLFDSPGPVAIVYGEIATAVI